MDEWTESDGGYVQQRGGDSVCTEDAMSDDHALDPIATMKWTVPISVFIGKDKTQRVKVKSSTHILRRWQNILTKLPGVIGPARNATTLFDALQMKF